MERAVNVFVEKDEMQESIKQMTDCIMNTSFMKDLSNLFSIIFEIFDQLCPKEMMDAIKETLEYLVKKKDEWLICLGEIIAYIQNCITKMLINIPVVFNIINNISDLSNLIDIIADITDISGSLDGVGIAGADRRFSYLLGKIGGQLSF